MLLARSLAALAALAAIAGPPAELIQIEARVVDRLGAPVTGLAADDIEIAVEGSRRPVLGAHRVSHHPSHDLNPSWSPLQTSRRLQRRPRRAEPHVSRRVPAVLRES